MFPPPPPWQVDLQSSEKKNDRLDAELQRVSLNMEEVKSEKQELSRRLSQQETQQESPDDPGSTGVPLQARCQALVSQLQDTQVKLATERDETRNTKRHVVALTGELTDIKRQMENLVTACDEERRKSNKFEVNGEDLD